MKYTLGKASLLFRIICRVCKDSREDVAHDTIHTLDHNAMFVGSQKLVVQDRVPDCMHQLTSTMSKNIWRWAVTCKSMEKFMENIW